MSEEKSAFGRWVEKVGGPKAASELLGVSYVSVYMWARGSTMPSPVNVKLVEKITEGAVSPADWYS